MREEEASRNTPRTGGSKKTGGPKKQGVTLEKTTDTGKIPKTGKKGKSDQDSREADTIQMEPQLTETEQLEVQLKELQDKYLRLSAEFDNYRKRTLREKVDLTKYAGEVIFIRLLPVLDDLERALKHVDETSNLDALKEGMRLICNKFREDLNQQGVSEIEALHKDFDTDLHEAVTKIPATEKELKGKIVDVLEKGYMLHDKVIRYSKVVIGE